MDWLSFITGILGIVVGAGGGILFYRQNRDAKTIANESALSLEWQKLYEEQREKREENEKKIEELTKRVFELEAKVSQLEIENNEIRKRQPKEPKTKKGKQ